MTSSLLAWTLMSSLASLTVVGADIASRRYEPETATRWRLNAISWLGVVALLAMFIASVVVR